MRKFFAIMTTLLMITAGVSAQDGKNIYNKYSDMDDVSAVYISSTMFKLIGKIPDMNIGSTEMNLTGLIKSLNNMFVIDCDNEDISDDIKTDVGRMLDKYKFEMLMEVKDNGEKVRIHISGDDDIVSTFLMTADDGDGGYTLIVLNGKMKRSELEKAIIEATKSIDD